MTIKENVETALNRIVNTPQKRVVVKRWSHVALFKEYLRRMAAWSKELNYPQNWLFFDVGAQIDKEIRAESWALRALEDYLTDYPDLGLMCDVYRWALHWAALESVMAFDLPAPYEPLLILYERGGFFRENQRGFWEVSGSFGVPRGSIGQYYHPQPIVGLDEQTLNLLDTDEHSL